MFSADPRANPSLPQNVSQPEQAPRATQLTQAGKNDIWDVIVRWTSDYVDIYYDYDYDQAYDNDQAVTADSELNAWSEALITEGKIKGFKAISSKTQLSQVLTMIIFTASAQHAAVNVPQETIMTYGPAVSGALWGEDEQQWLKTLMPVELASEQLNLLHLLGGVYYRKLGQYQSNDFPYRNWFEDKKVMGKDKA